MSTLPTVGCLFFLLLLLQLESFVALKHYGKHKEILSSLNVFWHCIQQATLPWKTATTSLNILILRPVLLVAQHTCGQWERCKTCLLGPLKMLRNLPIFIQCLITHGNLLSDSQNSLPLAPQSCSWCPTEVLHLSWAEVAGHAGRHGHHPGQSTEEREMIIWVRT